MKRRLSLTTFLSAVVLTAVPVFAQVSLLPAQESVVSARAVEQTVSPYLNPLQQQEWVVLDANGTIQGIYAQMNADGSPRMLGGVAVHLSRNGAPIQTSVTEADGRFVFSGLGVGTYAMVAKSQNSVAAFALHVLPPGASSRLDSSFMVFGTSVGGSAVTDIFRSHATPTSNVSGYYPDLQSDPLGDARQVSVGGEVKLRNGNVLAGRISTPRGLATTADLSGNVVHIMSNGRVVGRGVTNASGDFLISNVSPGVYDIVVAGKDGVAAGAFRAVAGAEVSMKSESKTKLVSAVQPGGVPDTLNLELVNPGDYFVGETEELFPPEEIGMAPVPGAGFVGPGGFAGGGGGGFGGGTGGGGSGGGRFGGLGALLGIGGLAAGVVALSNNDNVSVASP